MFLPRKLPTYNYWKALYTSHIFLIMVMYMVHAMINISTEANQILSIVKARYALRDKSDAINLVALEYAEELLEPELRPEFLEKMKNIAKEKSIKVENFAKRYGLK